MVSGWPAVRSQVGVRIFPSPAKIRINRLARRYANGRGGILLDVGSAGAKNSFLFRGSTYIGIDINHKLLRDATTRPSNGDLKVICCDAASLSVADKIARTIVSTHMLVYLGENSLLRFFGETARVLEPGGVLIAHVKATQLHVFDAYRMAYETITTYPVRANLSVRMEKYWHQKVGRNPLIIAGQLLVFLFAYFIAPLEGAFRSCSDVLVVATKAKI